MANLKQATSSGLATLIQKIRAILDHSRVVVSGSKPLYRGLCVAGVVSGILQFSMRRWPPSFVDATDGVGYLYVFGGMQIVGCLAILVGLYMHKDSEPSLHKVSTSLALERAGAALLVPVIASYTWGVIKLNGGPPSAWATLGLVAFGYYLCIRFYEIGESLKTLREPTVVADNDTEELRGE